MPSLLRVYCNELCNNESRWMDYTIFAIGGLLLLAHIVCLFARWYRVKWATQELEKRQRVLGNLIEVLPLLGLLGTVLALLQTFGNFRDSITMSEIIKNFAPALTTTASGIIMLIPNLCLNTILWIYIPRKWEEK